jgi:tryptophanyl-tRNA synthetase
MVQKEKSVLSCIQPTGDMHFGNYFGAVKNWVALQDQFTCYYGVVDYHAMTMPYQPNKLRNASWELIFNLLATGVKVENIFVQSMIPEHAELCWIFNCVASYGQLTRMTQFKDKSKQSQESSGIDGGISVGLLDYPVLQAADILVYRAHYVPVGKDQEQHLELTRDIAQRFNNLVGKDYFTLPEPLFTEIPKVMSPAEPTKKMSKSLGNKHYISVFAGEEVIRKQIKSAVTDTGEVKEGIMSPGVANLFELLKAGEALEAHNALMEDYNQSKLKYVDLKNAVADVLVDISSEMIARKQELLADKKRVKDQVKAAASQIRKVAKTTLTEVKELTGLFNAAKDLE